MEFNNPFKDLDKNKFKNPNSEEKKKSSFIDKDKDFANSSKYSSVNSDNYVSYSKNTKCVDKNTNSSLDSNSKYLESEEELSDDELFLKSMESTLKTDFSHNEKSNYFQKEQELIDLSAIKKSKKDKKKNTSLTKNSNERNTSLEKTIFADEKFSSFSSILDNKAAFKEKKLVKNQNMQVNHTLNKNVMNHKNKKILEETKIEPLMHEEDDFFAAMAGVKPIVGKEKIMTPEIEEIVIQNDPKPLLHDFEEGKLEFSLVSNNEHVQCNILGLDLLILAQLQNRHYNPESHIDLHGFNARQAFDALIPFFKNAYYKDMRCLLIVTGKGLNSFDGKPFLRNKVCDWLIQAPFNNIVLAFCTAKQQDGGSGALYILLRKRKKNAKAINWERLPNDYDLWASLDK